MHIIYTELIMVYLKQVSLGLTKQHFFKNLYFLYKKCFITRKDRVLQGVLTYFDFYSGILRVY